MTNHTLILAISASLLTAACGNDENESSKEPTVITIESKDNESSQNGVNTAYPVPSNTNQQSVPAADELEDSETKDQSDYQSADSNGKAYSDSDAIDYDDNYASNDNVNYDPNSNGYYDGLQNNMSGAYQEYNTYAVQPERPYLTQRYHSQRRFLNYHNSFNKVRPRHHKRWNQHHHDRTRRHFDRSRRWVNYDLYNIVHRTLRHLDKKRFKSRHGLEDKIRHSIGRRDHRNAVRLHDQILDESTRGKKRHRSWGANNGDFNGQGGWNGNRGNDGDDRRGNRGGSHDDNQNDNDRGDRGNRGGHGDRGNRGGHGNGGDHFSGTRTNR